MASSPLAASFHCFLSAIRRPLSVPLPTLFTLNLKVFGQPRRTLSTTRAMAHKESSSNNPDDSCKGTKSQSRFLLPSNGHVETSSAPSDPIEQTAWTFGHKTTLELTHNWGSETGPDFKGYHIGNSEPLGFGYQMFDFKTVFFSFTKRVLISRVIPFCSSAWQEVKLYWVPRERKVE